MSRTYRKSYVEPTKMVCRMIDGEIHVLQPFSNVWTRPIWYGDRGMNCKSSEEFIKFYNDLRARDGYAHPRDYSNYWHRVDNRNYRHAQNLITKRAVKEDPDTVDWQYGKGNPIYFTVW